MKLKSRLILFIAIVCIAATPLSRASASSGVEDIIQAYIKTFGTNWTSTPRDHLLKFLVPKILSFPDSQMQQVVRLLNTSKTIPHYMYAGAVEYDDKGSTLKLRTSVLGHPYSNIILVHETSHLSRVHLRAQISFMQEEALAFSDQYDYIRTTYTTSEANVLIVSRFKRLNFESGKRLIQHGLLGQHGEILALTAKQIAQIESQTSLQKEYEDYAQAFYDMTLAQDLKDAFQMTKKDYVTHRLRSMPYDQLAKSKCNALLTP